jgi:hypothetical protein
LISREPSLGISHWATQPVTDTRLVSAMLRK